MTWRKDGVGDKKARKFKCQSWRHVSSECSKWKAHQEYARLFEAISSRPGGWVYMVVTFDPKRWKNEWAAYRGAINCWAKLRKRLIRAWGKMEYAQTWERHQSGWPHVNILLRNEAIASACADAQRARRVAENMKGDLVDCGFGWSCEVGPMRKAAAMSSYLVKLASELVDAEGKGQVPTNAPRHFRRLRTSQGLLKKIVKDLNYTGELVQKPFETVEHKLQLEVENVQTNMAE